MKLFNRSLQAALVFFAAMGIAQGEVLLNTSKMNLTDFQVDLSFAVSETEYETEGQGLSEVDRQILAASGSLKLDSTLDAILQVGRILDSDLDSTQFRSMGDGDGFILGAGLKKSLFTQSRLQVIGYGLMTYTNEAVRAFDRTQSSNLLEVIGGVTATHSLQQAWKVYGSTEFVPYSEGTISIKNGGDIDFERDELLSIRIGTSYELDRRMIVRGELALLGEETITLSGSYIL